MSADARDVRLRDAVRRAIGEALDDGMRGSAVIRRMQSELDRLQESAPGLTNRQLAARADAIGARYGE